MKLDDIKRVYFIGIGGVGMSGLARYFNHRGCQVYGYDRTESPLTQQLQQENIKIIYQDKAADIPEIFRFCSGENLIVYTPAIPLQSEILKFFQQQGYTLHKRAEVLGIISRDHYTIAIAGTHGKTTTTALVTQVLRHAGYPCSAFIGGIASNIESNVWLDDSSKTLVVEADEFDRSFLHLHPDIAIVTSTDADHLDIYGDHAHLMESFSMFVDQVSQTGQRIIHQGLELPGDIYYAASDTAALRAGNIRIVDGKYRFDLYFEDTCVRDWQMGIPGIHNIENALAAIAVGRTLGLDYTQLKEGIRLFRGVQRRFEYIVDTQTHVYIDDYAHHPKELNACFSAVRELYPHKRLCVLFQPHLFTRTRDFMEDFAKALSRVDELILLPIYPARELPIEGIDAQALIEKIHGPEKQVLDKEEALEAIKQKRPELLVSVGAGDIDRMVPKLKEVLCHD